MELEPFPDQPLRVRILVRLHGRYGREPELPGRDLKALPPRAADRQHGRAVLDRPGRPPLLRVVEKDECSDWCAEALAVDGERRAAGHDHVQLLVMARSCAGLVVLL